MTSSSTNTSLSVGLRAILDQRFSCRAYLPRQVPSATLHALLAIAQRTPSWCNSQPWQVVITAGAATERLRSALQAAPLLADEEWDIAPPSEYAGVYRDRRRACGWQLYDSVGIAAGDREASGRQAGENFRLFGAPHVAVITAEPKLGTYGVLDCGAYVNNFLLAAASLGLAAVAQAALAAKAPVLREVLQIPADRHVVCGISFGYADSGHPANSFRTPRAPVEDAVRLVSE